MEEVEHTVESVIPNQGRPETVMLINSVLGTCLLMMAVATMMTPAISGFLSLHESSFSKGPRCHKAEHHACIWERPWRDFCLGRSAVGASGPSPSISGTDGASSLGRDASGAASTYSASGVAVSSSLSSPPTRAIALSSTTAALEGFGLSSADEVMRNV